MMCTARSIAWLKIAQRCALPAVISTGITECMIYGVSQAWALIIMKGMHLISITVSTFDRL